MLLNFPTGSNQTDAPDVIAALYFKLDGSWYVNTHEEIPPDSLIVIEEFVKFISYVAGQDDIISDFFEHQKEIESKDYDRWRRDNFKLINNDPENIP